MNFKKIMSVILVRNLITFLHKYLGSLMPKLLSCDLDFENHPIQIKIKVKYI